MLLRACRERTVILLKNWTLGVFIDSPPLIYGHLLGHLSIMLTKSLAASSRYSPSKSSHSCDNTNETTKSRVWQHRLSQLSSLIPLLPSRSTSTTTALCCSSSLPPVNSVQQWGSSIRSSKILRAGGEKMEQKLGCLIVEHKLFNILESLPSFFSRFSSPQFRLAWHYIEVDQARGAEHEDSL